MSTHEIQYDIAIIGAGIIGCMLANQLSYSKFGGRRLKTILIERSSDFAGGATRANSAIIHGEYAASASSLKGQLLSEGRSQWAGICDRLGVPYKKIGALVLAFDQAQSETLEALEENGRKNTSSGQGSAIVLNRDETLRRQANLNPELHSSLFDPEVAIISPYEACIALGQEAGRRSVSLAMNREPVSAEYSNDFWRLGLAAPASPEDDGRKEAGEYIRARVVINATGANAAALASLFNDSGFSMNLRRGQYIIFRRGSGALLNHVIFQAPNEKGKGVLVTPTVWGNLMIGPNAESIDDPFDTTTSVSALEEIVEKARLSLPDLPLSSMMRDFSGVRAGIHSGDFHIAASGHQPALIHAAGIDSPGLSASPAIVQRLLHLTSVHFGEPVTMDEKQKQQWFTGPAGLSPLKDIKADVQLDRGQGRRILCRCEQVREQTIDEACHQAEQAGLRLMDRDSIKRRTRAGMGLCQGKFCASRVNEYLATRYAVSEPEISDGRKPSDQFLKFIRKINT